MSAVVAWVAFFLWAFVVLRPNRTPKERLPFDVRKILKK